MEDNRRRTLLLVLGDGGTTAMAERLMAYLDERVRPEDIVGLAEIASRLGVTKQRLWNWTGYRDTHFPPPIAQLATGRVYDWTQVQTWAQGNADMIKGAQKP